MNNFEDFLLNELFEAYYKARVGGKRKTMDEHSFEINDIDNIVNLRNAIMARKYKPSRGVAFIIHDPVTREVFAAPFIDRVVHHFLFKFTNQWWEPRLWKSSYSCRKNKGTLCGIQDLQRNMRRATENGTKDAYVLKRDIRGYFMSLERKRLYERICWGLDRQFPNGGELYRTIKYLWKEVIFDDPCRGITIRGRKSDWDDLPPEKSLFNQPEGRGIVIGNLTSQLLSNIYLDQLDRFMVYNLGFKNYGRYVDDFYAVVKAEELNEAKAKMNEAEKYLTSLGLTMHPKKKFNLPVKDGVEFLGAKIYWDHIVPGERISQNFAKNLYKLESTGKGKPESVTSYDGHLAHYNSHKLIKKIYDGLGWDYNYPKLPKKTKNQPKKDEEDKKDHKK